MGGRNDCYSQYRCVTPSDEAAADEQSIACRERLYDDSVKIDTLAEHPHEVARYEVLRDNVQSATPYLQSS